MFGRNKEEKKTDVAKVQAAAQAAKSTHGIKSLSVKQGDNVIEIHGVAETVAAKQQAMKVITDQVGTTAGVVNKIDVARDTDSVKPMTPPTMPSVRAAGGPRTHTVKKGETLSHIAQHYYGKASEFQKIFSANRDQLSDPDKIREGMTLHIP